MVAFFDIRHIFRFDRFVSALPLKLSDVFSTTHTLHPTSFFVMIS
jgi:hypothetical protein